ncbi:DNA-binding transcriptional activator PspC [Erwinia sp. OLTSP20]|uniref:envelope stress response membrane protein PspC n=1 Tax=unclassified Erwinia TaxID=2622719 RepID=UPI000C18A18F|nr:MULTISPECIES: envelope stress response membrane protein PspC [unclassified Erwinia]PIJ51774.1 DNA-binding transcriptional activator PspC [Erwinia sp. OAMSP11]PIJ74363.1 DNA-binding transcriptional activator PspC [Erwinia sp. OLSSP12]PIJ83804.1 DNA-binding transcriptional activator PspC [Erwinia sp. OLCASP19]PIJ86847.1 DNA-binding transcriptional activator PspC [Erwinia sp. OLMTSP26]PIJ88254.1 DNA-binding transcriptional activator PspC [Erwinia sp. OLMDSP33]
MFQGRKLYRIPEEGKIKGVCAGIARYLEIPVTLVRVISVLSLFFGLFAFTAVLYIILSFVLDPLDAQEATTAMPPSRRKLLDEADALLRQGEDRLRDVERYVTSETFSTRSRFRQL